MSEITAGVLHGTLIDKRRKDPVVLIVPGSGPTDRDGNNPMGMKSDAYKMLAERLIAEDIASVRIDKRGMFGSAGAGDPNITSPQAYVDDIHAWIDAIKAERGTDCVFLLGHSEGALLVSLAAEGRKDVCGLILVSGMGRTFGAVVREQLTSNPANAPVLDQAMHALDELSTGRDVDVSTMHPALAGLFAPNVQPYMKALINIDPVEALRRADKQALIVQGTHDIQISVEDAKLLHTAPKTRLRLIENMNHILKEAPADRAGNIATYSDPSLPLAKGLVSKIEDFIDDND
ncbi:MAG: alpha/beta fold hydrolase [Burkholderiales bacterium]|nr:MAG: alpha/beta fold hydrolase [Burkholderiales bacterium]